MPCVVATFKIQFFKFASLWQIIENTMFYLILILFKFKNWTFDWPQTIHEYSLDGPLQCHHFPIFQKSQDDYRYIIYFKINKMIYLKLDVNANCAWIIRRTNTSSGLKPLTYLKMSIGMFLYTNVLVMYWIENYGMYPENRELYGKKYRF